MLFKHAHAGKVALLFLLSLAAALAGRATDNNTFIEQAEKEFQRAQKSFQTDPQNSTNSWRFASACFDRADLATNDARRAESARLGIAACQQLLAREPKSAPGHYYLAMNFGQLAEAEAPSIAAYKLVHEVEHEFKAAAAVDEHFDFAGPPRCLGLLYRDAPGWPISIGSKRKAKDFLEQAARLAPDYPENQLNLAESYLNWRQREEAEKALAKLDALWPAAQTNLGGELWGKSWHDWSVRRAAAKTEFQKVFKHAPGHSNLTGAKLNG